jgi:hypothetical protein
MAKQTFTTGQVLTAAQMTSLQQTAMLGGAASAKTASYTLVAADAGTAITMSNASATVITVNTGLFAAGDTIQITNLGAGVCTITAGTATVNTSAVLALTQYESGTLTFISTSAAIFIKGAGSAATSGGMTLISETVASASTGISFTSLGSYKQLLLMWSSLSHSTTGSDFSLRFNNNSGSVYGSHGFQSTGTSYNTGESLLSSVAGYQTDFLYSFGRNASAVQNGGAAGSILIDNYTSSTKSKTCTIQFGYYDNNVARYQNQISLMNFNDTTPITSLDIVRLSGSATISNNNNSTIRLYGIQ